MASGASNWTWDAARQDYYYVTQDNDGTYTYHYRKSQAQQAPAPTTAGASAHSATSPYGYDPTTYTDVSQRPRADSSTDPPLPPKVPAEVRQSLYPHLIEGTPSLGWYEGLDPSYHMRTGAEIYEFFKVGKVFAMLHIQAASANDPRIMSDNITVVKYGERAFSQIRRFVVVDVKRGFVYACPISTYNGRATLKPGCIPSEHSLVYFAGTTSTPLPGEEGLTKYPIRINPASPTLRMDQASRLHYGKMYPIEMNVKVKDIGDVDPSYVSLLLQYYRELNSPSESQPQNYQPQYFYRG